MSWNPGGGGGSPWGGGGPGGPGGPQAPNLAELLSKGLDRFKRIIPGGAGSSRGLALIGLIALAIWLATGLYRVLPDEQGVVLTFGRWDGQTTQPGLHYRLPSPIQTVQTPKVTRVNRLDIGSRRADPRSRARGVDVQDIPEESLMLTGDENIVDISEKKLPISDDIRMTAAMMKTEPSAMIRAYSTALAPPSSFSNDVMKVRSLRYHMVGLSQSHRMKPVQVKDITAFGNVLSPGKGRTPPACKPPRKSTFHRKPGAGGFTESMGWPGGRSHRAASIALFAIA